MTIIFKAILILCLLTVAGMMTHVLWSIHVGYEDPCGPMPPGSETILGILAGFVLITNVGAAAVISAPVWRWMEEIYA